LLEIEPNVIFLVEKDGNKPITLSLYADSRFGWFMNKVTKISGDSIYNTTGSFGISTPTTYHQKQ